MGKRPLLDFARRDEQHRAKLINGMGGGGGGVGDPVTLLPFKLDSAILLRLRTVVVGVGQKRTNQRKINVQ